MPKETFFNLPDEKKKKIADSVYRLLENNRFEDISINMIIRESEIPRGSFYQYFDDREDLIRYLFSDFRKQLSERMSEGLIEYEGRIQEFAIEILDEFVAFGTDERNIRIFSNAFSDLNILGMFISDTMKEQEILVEEIKKHIDKRKLRELSEKELNILINLGIAAFKDTAYVCFKDAKVCDNAINDFKIKMDILANGVLLREGEIKR